MKAAFDQNRRGMVLPFTPLSITFDDIRYSVDMPQVLILVPARQFMFPEHLF